MARERRPSRLRDAGGVSEGGCAPLRSWSFLENVGLNEAIWCTIFHHVKHLTARVYWVIFFFALLNRMVKKVEGPCPPVWKVEGPLAPLSPPPPPGSAAYDVPAFWGTFFAKFGIAIKGFSSETKESKLHKLGIFRANYGKKHPI